MFYLHANTHKRKRPYWCRDLFCLTVWNGYTVYSNTIRPQIGDYRVECTKVEFVATEVAAPKPQAEEKLFEETCGKFSWQVYTKDSNGNKVWVDAD